MFITTFTRNFFATSSIQVLAVLLTASVSIIAARILGPAAFGSYSWVLSIVALLTLPVTAGFQQLTARETNYFLQAGKLGELKGFTFWSAGHHVLVSVAMVFMIFIGSRFANLSQENEKLLLLASWMIPFIGFLDLLQNFLIAAKHPFQAKLIGRLARAFFTLLFFIASYYFWLSVTVESLVYAHIASLVVTLVIASVYCRIQIYRRLEAIAEFHIRHWYFLLFPIAAIVFVRQAQNEFGVILLGVLQSKESVAFFKVASHVVSLFAIALYTANIIIGPKLAKAFRANDLVGCQSMLTQSARLTTFVVLVSLVAFLFVGKPLLVFLFGNAYVSAYEPLVVLLLAQLFSVMCGSVSMTLNMLDQSSVILRVAVETFILFLVTCIPFILAFDFIGLAYSSALCTVYLNFRLTRSIKKKFHLTTHVFFLNEMAKS